MRPVYPAAAMSFCNRPPSRVFMISKTSGPSSHLILRDHVCNNRVSYAVAIRRAARLIALITARSDARTIDSLMPTPQ